MRSYSYLNTAEKIIHSFDGSMPFSVWIKNFFKSEKKFGSRDRKQISHACYSFYRIGHAFKKPDIHERLLIALFLCSGSSNEILHELKPEWNEKILLPVSEKIKYLSAEDEVQYLFPFSGDISDQIDFEQFSLSVLVQPDLFLRIRPGKKRKVLEQLKDSGLNFNLLDNDCVQLSNQSKIDEVLSIDEDVVVQDYNSQRVLEILDNSKPPTQYSKLSTWDCCAASGGKSILFHDYFPEAGLTVSDIRRSIVFNLQKRFKRAGIKNYISFVADISSSVFSIESKFDMVICDAPCSGSGTWSRTPEQLYFFQPEKIETYSDLQKKIVVNSSKALSKGGFFLYITCSIFKKENEGIVEFIQNNLTLRLCAMQYLKGYDKKADTLFTALFIND